jgi:hypothetical protein
MLFDSWPSTATRCAPSRCPDLGTLVSATLVDTVDTGYTSFSLLGPDVDLATARSSVVINTEGVTTVHQIFAGLIGHPQSETHHGDTLNGTAIIGPLP